MADTVRGPSSQPALPAIIRKYNQKRTSRKIMLTRLAFLAHVILTTYNLTSVSAHVRLSQFPLFTIESTTQQHFLRGQIVTAATRVPAALTGVSLPRLMWRLNRTGGTCPIRCKQVTTAR